MSRGFEHDADRPFGAATLRAAVALLFACGFAMAQEPPVGRVDDVWRVPDVASLPNDEYGRLVRRGRDLVARTQALIGPHATEADERFAGNDLACADCHLQNGIKKFGLPLFGLAGEFPAYSFRRGGEISLAERVNSCMTRSLNGRALPLDSAQMQAFVAYIDFLSLNMARGKQLSGHGAGEMPELDRAAEPVSGAKIYVERCAECHGRDGGGVARDPQALALGYAVPPLWGNDSFNNGAGLARLIDMANFVHSNMPAGADYLNPILSGEEAWDVAAYVESRPRPRKAGLAQDFPDLLHKPVDAPYGPYADGFSEAQHKYGPFGPIRAEIARLKAEGVAPK